MDTCYFVLLLLAKALLLDNSLTLSLEVIATQT